MNKTKCSLIFINYINDLPCITEVGPAITLFNLNFKRTVQFIWFSLKLINRVIISLSPV